MSAEEENRNTGATEAKIYEGSGSGSAALAGYEYQIDVSVWLALDLILVTRMAESLVLEPASEEDLEATLTDAEPGRLVNRIPMMGYTLIVQAKLRNGDAWTPVTIRSLLKHGSDSRLSAAKRLENTNSRYLLVTSAGVNGEAQRLNCRRAGTWPAASAMPSSLTNGIAHDISGRVAVIANQDDERLRGDINRLLTEACRVPNSRLDACRIKLREEARARIARAGGGRWTRDELEEVIRHHDGYLASAQELEHYVHPNNWKNLRNAMAERSAAIIIGQSGTGKTLATQMLYDELRQEIPGLTRVLIRLGPSQLRDDTTPPPVLYDIEDPWGRFDFDPNSRPWNDQLGDFLAAARPDRMIIATSRLDVARESGALQRIQPWVIGLEAENYGTQQRQRLFRSRISSLPRELQQHARTAERHVLDNLATPLEIQKFFDAMRTQDRDGIKNPSRFVMDAVDHAHQNSIEQTVIEQIESRNDVRAAAVLWGLLVANDKLTRSLLREIEDRLADKHPDMERGVSPLIDFFVAARNLRQIDGGILTYYHPRVEAGVIRTLEKHRQIVRRTLYWLVDVLVSDVSSGTDWGVAAAARICAKARELYGVIPSSQAAVRIDAWLESNLVEGGSNFRSHLELAATAGSPASNAAEVARYLLHRPDLSFGGLLSWGKPERSADWYAARRSNPSTKPLVETFVRTLPHDNAWYPISLADNLAQLSPGLESAFLDAARTIVHYGYIAVDDAVAHGALNDIDSFEAIVDIAIDVLTPTEEILREVAKTKLDIINDVYSSDYAQHLADDDSGHTAREFLCAFVQRVRKERGWQQIAQHRYADRLRWYWLRELTNEAREGQVDWPELAEAFRASYDTADEGSLWPLLQAAWPPQYSQALENRIKVGGSDQEVRQAALETLLQHSPQSLSRILDNLVEQGAHNRLAEISIEIANLCCGHRHGSDEQIAFAKEVVAQLPEPFREISNAQIYLLSKASPLLSDAARDALASIPDVSDRVRTLRLELDASVTLPIKDDVLWALNESDDAAIAVLAIKTAIRHEMSAEIRHALDHRFAHVVAQALTAASNSVETPIPAQLLAFVTHRASPVRRALVDALQSKPHPAHQSTLVKLARDKWTEYSSFRPNDPEKYPIARAAVAALLDVCPLGSEDNEALYAIALETTDPHLRGEIFRLLARAGAHMQKNLFDLAVAPGRASVRSSAAFALLVAHEQIDQRLIDEVTPTLLATRYEPVACAFSLLLGLRGTIPAVRAAAESLAANSKRKALVLLIVRALMDRNSSVAKEIATMLPVNHGAIAWALGGTLAETNDALIADLGDPAVCAQVLEYMRH